MSFISNFYTDKFSFLHKGCYNATTIEILEVSAIKLHRNKLPDKGVVKSIACPIIKGLRKIEIVEEILNKFFHIKSLISKWHPIV